MCGAIENFGEGLVRGTSGSGNSLAQSVLDLTVQAFSGGFAQYKKDKGGFQASPKDSVPIGVLGIDTFKDVSGATTKEQALAASRKQFEEQKAQRAEDISNARVQNAADQLAKSRRASSVRSTSGSSSSSPRSSISSGLGGEERDFLGL